MTTVSSYVIRVVFNGWPFHVAIKENCIVAFKTIMPHGEIGGSGALDDEIGGSGT